MQLAINRDSDDATLCRQIYQSLREAIVEGRWEADFRLPSSRALASDLGVSRATVLAAYDQLKVEGYIEGRAGGGTRVSPNIPHARDPAKPADPRHEAETPEAKLSDLGAQMVAAFDHASPASPGDRPVPFTLGAPAFDAFPVSTWARLMTRRWRTTPRSMLAADDGPGYAPLRNVIAQYITPARAVRCTADQIVITAGAQQGIDLIARLLLNPGDAVWIEAHGYGPARAAFAGVGAQVVSIPVDSEGVIVERGRELAPNARLAFVTPTFTPPLGVQMSLSRRLALLDWAESSNAWIVEDDYNGELQYAGKLMPALQGLEHPGARRVIYLRTFTKTLFPALRLGYAVLPSELVGPFADARRIADRHSPTAEQAVLADFIAEGHFARHVRAMRALHAERQRVFLDLADQELGTLLQMHSAPAGLRLVGYLQPGLNDDEVAAEAARRGVVVSPLSRHSVDRPDEGGLIMGYAPFRAAETREALARLAGAIRTVAHK